MTPRIPAPLSLTKSTSPLWCERSTTAFSCSLTLDSFRSFHRWCEAETPGRPSPTSMGFPSDGESESARKATRPSADASSQRVFECERCAEDGLSVSGQHDREKGEHRRDLLNPLADAGHLLDDIVGERHGRIDVFSSDLGLADEEIDLHVHGFARHGEQVCLSPSDR